MPYEGDSPVEAWEYWFDEPPSEDAVEWLNNLAKANTPPLVVESIAIAGSKALVITEEQARLKYLTGILRRKQLETVLPERAAEEHKIDIVRKAWDERQFRFPIDRKRVREWLSFTTPEDLCAAISLSLSWTAFNELLKALQHGFSGKDLKILHNNSDSYTEFRSLVAEAIAIRIAKQA